MEQRRRDIPNNTSPGEHLIDRCLYVEYRVYFDPRTNQDLLHEVAEAAQESIYSMFDGGLGINDKEGTSGPLPSPHDVTYEVVMVIDGDRQPRTERDEQGIRGSK